VGTLCVLVQHANEHKTENLTVEEDILTGDDSAVARSMSTVR